MEFVQEHIYLIVVSMLVLAGLILFVYMKQPADKRAMWKLQSIDADIKRAVRDTASSDSAKAQAATNRLSGLQAKRTMAERELRAAQEKVNK